MQLSVIIINYNTFELTCNCIQSIINYTENVEFEIILVDNASSECKPDKFLDRFPMLNLIVSETNKGFAGGNNIGIQRAKGEVILLLNSDTELIEDSITICYNYLKQTPAASVVSPMLIYPNGEIQPQCQRFPSIKLELIELFRLHKLVTPPKQGEILLSTFFDHKLPARPDWLWGTFFMFNKSILQLFKDQLLPADFFMYGEDKQWCWELQRHKKEIHYYPLTKIIHHVSGSSAKAQAIDKIKLMREHEKILVEKYYGIFYWHILKWLQIFKYITLLIKNRQYVKYLKIIYSI